MTFKVGDLVRLKSGGPLMTVSNVGTAGGQLAVWCVWFEKDDQKSATFPPDALEAGKKPQSTRLIRS
jgi:uncharacterized protein YodC (DUF2158 family)